MKLKLRRLTRCSVDREAIERLASEELDRQVAQGKPPAQEWDGLDYPVDADTDPTAVAEAEASPAAEAEVTEEPQPIHS
ncbi:MAG: hypothetical protein ACT4OS_00500 [Acidimicrobiales bacterium]